MQYRSARFWRGPPYPIVICRYAKWCINYKIEVSVYYRKSYSESQMLGNHRCLLRIIGGPYSERPISKAFASWKLSFEYVGDKVMSYSSEKINAPAVLGGSLARRVAMYKIYSFSYKP